MKLIEKITGLIWKNHFIHNCVAHPVSELVYCLVFPFSSIRAYEVRFYILDSSMPKNLRKYVQDLYREIRSGSLEPSKDCASIHDPIESEDTELFGDSLKHLSDDDIDFFYSKVVNKLNEHYEDLYREIKDEKCRRDAVALRRDIAKRIELRKLEKSEN